jgi:hypothetical protein
MKTCLPAPPQRKRGETAQVGRGIFNFPKALKRFFNKINKTLS